MRFALHGRRSILELPHEDGLDLLEWLGLGRAEFGAVEVNVLLPLCRRRLWPEPRNVDPPRPRHGGGARPAGTLCRLTSELAERVAGAPGEIVHFG